MFIAVLSLVFCVRCPSFRSEYYGNLAKEIRSAKIEEGLRSIFTTPQFVSDELIGFKCQPHHERQIGMGLGCLNSHQQSGVVEHVKGKESS